ncbi:MAG: ABC transporter substrate-binding protein, partial [Halocynthiibacter sp.]
MFAVLSAARKSPACRLLSRNLPGRAIVLLSALWLAGCEPGAVCGATGRTINTQRPVPVALLVPQGSARQGDVILAQSLENAARLAISDLDGVNIDLRVYATAGLAGQAADVAREAVRDGAKIILGPVFADAANAAGVAVAGRNVNVLAFSNNTEIAGGNVFVMGSTFQNTANRLVSYSVAQGKGRILVVHGRDTAEDLGRDAIVAAINRSGGTVAAVVPFELSQQALFDAIPVIARQARSSGAQSIFFTSGT